jgi:hypothetical protein
MDGSSEVRGGGFSQRPRGWEPSLGERVKRCSSAHDDLAVGEWADLPVRTRRELDIERGVAELETRLPR